MDKKSRRDFLKVLTAGTCGAAAHQYLSPATSFLAMVQPEEAMAEVGDMSVLVILDLQGGAPDRLAPIYHGAYRDKNPDISYGPSDSIALGFDQGLHPALTGLKPIWDDGQLALINKVGYRNHNRSHAESHENWYRGRPEESGNMMEGWAARLTSQVSTAFGGVSLAGTPTLIKGGTNPPRSVSNLTSFGEQEVFWDRMAQRQLSDVRLNVMLDGDPRRNPGKELMHASINRLQGNVEQLRQLGSQNLPVTFPNTDLGRKFADAARVIAAGPLLGVRFLYVAHGGYDLHTNEKAGLAGRLAEVNGAVTAFITCMKSLNRWNDIFLATMSEFSRTFQNASLGSDHGTSGPMLVMGGRVVGGQKGPVPEPSELVGTSYFQARHFDFTQVYGTLINRMGLDASKVFPDPLMSSTPYLNL